MVQRVTRSSWSIEPHPAWSVVDDPECLTLTRSDESGALQLSSAIKEIGDITQDEILEFASEDSEVMGSPFPIKFQQFTGYGVSYSETGVLWHRYWLANSCIMIFATYNGSATQWESECSEVLQMLGSLKVIH